MAVKKIIVATKNQGKVKEMINAFSNLPVELHSLSEFGNLADAVEDGATFEENAIKKALFYMKATNCACLADDSGLEIDALDKAPGIYSARFAGYHADDKANNEKMIEELHKKNLKSSIAQYVCSLAFVDTDNTVITTSGKCQGIIRDFPEGTNGFGYDPYFFVEEFNKTMASISLKEKNSISHRGKAICDMESELKQYLK